MNLNPTKKNLFLFLALLCSPHLFLTLALASEFNRVPDAELAKYKEATAIAFRDSGFTIVNPHALIKCSQEISYVMTEIENGVKMAKQLNLSTDNSQPALIFSMTLPNYSYSLQITTASDDKSILSLRLLKYGLGRILNGSLKNPVIVDGITLLETLSCDKLTAVKNPQLPAKGLVP